ncbi:MAG: sigma 54-interacting transcriptional regulator [bacterium]
MKIKNIMTNDPITISQEHTIKKTASLFYSNKIDGVPVVDNDNKIIGLFTKSHLMKAITNDINLEETISELMEKEVVTINQNNDIETAWSINAGRLPVVDDDQNLIGILTRTDLVEAFYKNYKKVAQEYDAIFNFTHNGIISVDIKNKIINCNQAAADLLEIEKEEIIGSHFKRFFGKNNLGNVLNTGNKELGERVTYKDKTLLANRSPLYKNDKLYGAISVFQDISELEEALEELDSVKNLNKQLDAIIESVSDGIYITNGSGDTLRINNSYEKITGIKSEDVIGRNMKELVDEGIFSESVTFKVLEKREPVSIIHEIKTGQNVLSTGHPVFNENDEIVRVVTTARDVNKLNKLKEELDKTKELSKKYYSELKKLRLQQLQLDEIIVKSDKMEKVFNLAMQISRVDSTVLISGESGVGKEIVARTIHKASDRKDHSLIKINCGAIPDNLLEAELFGYEEGAFTGAKETGKPGMFELADKGTLLLDEIAELPLNLQVKLLRAIQEKEINRIGGIKPIKIDTRIIAATNKDLESMMNNGDFREDLYYRLNVVPIKIPPLRERKSDISQLIHLFLSTFNKKYNKNKSITLDTIDILEEYNWPGNVRELKNLVERFVVMTEEDIIKPEYLPNKILLESGNKDEIIIDEIIPLKEAVNEIEKRIISKALEKFNTTYEVAKVLEVSQPTIVRKKKKYNLNIDS